VVTPWNIFVLPLKAFGWPCLADPRAVAPRAAIGARKDPSDVRMSGLKAHMPFDLVGSKIMTAFHANNGSDAERLVRDRT
jgi:hypothetical protein